MHSRVRLLSIAIIALIGLLAACSGPARPGSTTSSETSADSPTDSDAEQQGAEAPGPQPVPADIPDPHSLTGPDTATAVPPVEPLPQTPTPALPATVTDERGASVTVEDVDRILALDIYGTLTETVIALGLGDYLVGRTSSTTDPGFAHLPNVTPGGHELNAEALLALAPTVVLVDGTLGPQEIYTQLEQSGIAVVFMSAERAVDTISAEITAVAAALGVSDAGVELNERVTTELGDAQEYLSQLAPSDPAQRLKIAFLYVRGSGAVFFIFGAGSGADGLISFLGGIDVASEAGIVDYKPASAESLAVINPDLILMMSSGLESAGGLAGILARPGMSATTAGSKQRIVDMADGSVLAFGPNYARVIVSLADAIYLGQ